MANHGYLPRDGRNMSLSTLVKAQVEVFNVSYELATGVALAGSLACARGFTVDMEQL